MREEEGGRRGTGEPEARRGFPTPRAAPPPAPVPKRAGWETRRDVLAILAAGLLLLGGGVGLWALRAKQSTSPTVAHVQSQTGRVVAAKGSAADAADAIVNITTFSLGRGGGGGKPKELGAGSGLILTSSGEVLTNNHVIQGATSIQMEIAGRPGRYWATVKGADPADDVALLQLHGVSALPSVTLEGPSAVHVGEQVLAIGNSLGGGGAPTVTAGKIVRLHRAINVLNPMDGPHQLTDLIQLDVETSPGDSGGALVNSAGKVVGMITAGGIVASATFGIPSTNALKIVRAIRAGDGSSTILIGERGFFGAGGIGLDRQIAARLGLAETSGVLVVRVQPQSPAAKAGIRRRAVIEAVGGHAVRSIQDLESAIYAHTPGQRVRVRWSDSRGKHKATVTLVSGPAV